MDERAIVVVIDGEIKKQKDDAARLGRELLDIDAFILDAIGDLDVVRAVKPCLEMCEPFILIGLRIRAVDGRMSP